MTTELNIQTLGFILEDLLHQSNIKVLHVVGTTTAEKDELKQAPIGSINIGKVNNIDGLFRKVSNTYTADDLQYHLDWQRILNEQDFTNVVSMIDDRFTNLVWKNPIKIYDIDPTLTSLSNIVTDYSSKGLAIGDRIICSAYKKDAILQVKTTSPLAFDEIVAPVGTSVYVSGNDGTANTLPYSKNILWRSDVATEWNIIADSISVNTAITNLQTTINTSISQIQATLASLEDNKENQRIRFGFTRVEGYDGNPIITYNLADGDLTGVGYDATLGGSALFSLTLNQDRVYGIKINLSAFYDASSLAYSELNDPTYNQFIIENRRGNDWLFEDYIAIIHPTVSPLGYPNIPVIKKMNGIDSTNTKVVYDTSGAVNVTGISGTPLIKHQLRIVKSGSTYAFFLDTYNRNMANGTWRTNFNGNDVYSCSGLVEVI